MTIIDLLNNFTSLLEESKIEYMLSGSLAMNFYSVSRATRDIDLVVQIQKKDVDVILSKLPEFYFHKESILVEIEKNGMFNLIDTQSGFKIDMIVFKNDDYAHSAFARRRKFDDFGKDIDVIALEDLILAKLRWIQVLQSERQMQDIKMLLQNEPIDKEYLYFWVNKLGLNTYNLL